ncbi:hypothetical protein PIB30_085342 [Stylosanthes scabra]|uniref:Putative plant transposon protein domain-containing protein n=1 Tax=Stylosanthes scabra TaxID=79078 RepID=A0ABU6YS11_9FABA|nr:hypothetical protein [Stylosanthes scabra]
MIPTRNKSEITVARAVLIHSIIKGNDVRVEELIADNIAVLAEGVQGRSKLCFPSTIYRLCKEAGVPMGEFKDGENIQIAKPITAKVMTTTRGKIINQPQNQPMEEDEDDNDAENRFANHDQDQEMNFEATGAKEDHHQYHDQPHFEAYESNFQQYKEDQQQGFQFLNEELASMKIKQEQFFENMQKAQSQYLEELKSLRTKQDEMVNQQNNFYTQIKREHAFYGGELISMELSSQKTNKENPHKLLTNLCQILLILRIRKNEERKLAEQGMNLRIGLHVIRVAPAYNVEPLLDFTWKA